jgi:3-hydroxyisobutyrate dehydrogenase-like beta-hydroxyacid dehydrogenase
VAANLRASGHQVYVWSRSPHSSPNFLGSVVEVADLCEVIQIFVSDDVALLDMARTIAAALKPHHVVCGHATVSAEAAREAGSIVESQGARYLDAPFTGSRLAAQNKELVYYIGGDEQALAEVRPILESTARKVIHIGGIGDASIVKIVTNMLTATTVQTLAESLALVRAAGIDGQRLVDALASNASGSATSAAKLPAMIAQNFEANFSLKHMCKDLNLALDLAEEFAVSMPTTETTADIFAETLDKGWEDEDFSVVARNYPLPPLPEPPPAPEPEKAEAAPAPASPAAEPPPQDAPAAPKSAEAPAPAPVPSATRKSAIQTLKDLFKPEPDSRERPY